MFDQLEVQAEEEVNVGAVHHGRELMTRHCQLSRLKTPDSNSPL